MKLKNVCKVLFPSVLIIIHSICNSSKQVKGHSSLTEKVLNIPVGSESILSLNMMEICQSKRNYIPASSACFTVIPLLSL